MIYNCKINELQTMSRRYLKIYAIQKRLNVKDHDTAVKEFFDKRKEWKTSMLGGILFQNETDYTGSKKYTYLILIWKHWLWLQNRHVYSYRNKPHNPLEGCSVTNCKFTGDNQWFHVADAVLVHLQQGLLPNTRNRRLYQRWVFLSDEAPVYASSYTKGKFALSKLANIFNWSMTYRTDADVPVPYGRTVPLSNSIFTDLSYQNLAELVPNWKIKRRDVLVTVLMSHCISHRMRYMKELKKHINVDVYGLCSDKKLVNICPGHYKVDCTKINEYLFYLVLENSMCRQYMTEKLFYNAYHKGAIPIIKGPPLQDCKALLPPNSFIHVDDFLTPSDMAEELIRISKDNEKLLSYHMWRNDFEVVNEHGYYGTNSMHLCRLCEAMNYNDEGRKVYTENDIRSFLDEKLLCNNLAWYNTKKRAKKTTPIV